MQREPLNRCILCRSTVNPDMYDERKVIAALFRMPPAWRKTAHEGTPPTFELQENGRLQYNPPMVDLDYRVEIDLTGEDDGDDEVEIVGERRGSSSRSSLDGQNGNGSKKRRKRDLDRSRDITPASRSDTPGSSRNPTPANRFTTPAGRITTPAITNMSPAAILDNRRATPAGRDSILGNRYATPAARNSTPGNRYATPRSSRGGGGTARELTDDWPHGQETCTVDSRHRSMLTRGGGRQAIPQKRRYADDSSVQDQHMEIVPNSWIESPMPMDLDPVTNVEPVLVPKKPVFVKEEEEDEDERVPTSTRPTVFNKEEEEEGEYEVWGDMCEDSGPHSDQEYDCIHAGFDVHDESRWKTPKENSSRVENDVLEPREDLSIKIRLPVKYGRQILRGSRGSLVRPPKHPTFIWDMLSDTRPTSVHTYREKPSMLRQHAKFGKIVKEKSMRVDASFKVAPGSVNRIDQYNGWVAIGSACTGGQADEPDEQPNPYNRSGSLLTWNGQHHVLQGHYLRKEYGTKHYTINDVRFNPSGDSLVSTGMDRTVRVWRCPEGARGYSGGYALETYDDGIPFELAFQPGDTNSNVLAVGVKDIYVYNNLQPISWKTKVTLDLTSKSNGTHNAGAMRWDHTRTHVLYASSEPQDNGFSGIHKAFDVNRGREIVTFNIREAGDAMALHHGILALATKGEENNRLRLFDVSNRTKHHSQEAALEQFAHGALREVSCMTFSPDGIYLALARADNSVHLYDSRMLGKGVLHAYKHDAGQCISPESSLYGITYTEWVSTHTGGAVLLSGGEDGCVRLWDPTWSNEEPLNGRKLVEVNSDIGCFSVGDVHKNERDLVVGDSSGEVTIYSGLLNYL